GVTGFISNYVVAAVRSLSGLASEKFPQDNQTVQELALNYRLIPEVVPHPMYLCPTPVYPSDWTNYPAWTNSPNPGDWQWRSNFWMLSQVLQTNLADVRLIFRWPLINGSVGNNRQVFRTQMSGHVMTVYEPWGLLLTDPRAPNDALYFFVPHNYVK